MPRLDKIREHLPNVRLKFLNLPTADAVKRLADGVIDFALVRKDAVTRPLQAKSLGVMGYSLFVPAGLQATAGRIGGLKLLDTLPLATLEGEGSFRSDLRGACAMRSLSWRSSRQLRFFYFPAKSMDWISFLTCFRNSTNRRA